MAAEPLGSPPPRRRLNVPAPEGARRGRRVRATAALGIAGRRPLDLDRRRLLHEAAGRRRRGGHQGRGARGRPVATVVGLGRGDPARRRRCALQLPRRLQAQRRDRRRGPGEPSTRCTRLLDSADAVVWSHGSPLAEQRRWPPARWSRAHPHLVVTSITPFGLDGPWSDKPATEFTLQAWSGGDRRTGAGAARTPARVRRRPDRGVARRHVYGAIGTLAARRRAAIGRRARRRLHARGAGDVPHLLPRDLQRPAGPTDAPQALRGDARRRGGQRRARRAGVRDGAAMAGLLRAGGAPRVDGGPVALPRPHRPGAHDRRLDRGPHGRRGVGRRRRPSGSPMHPSPTARTPPRGRTSANGGRSSPIRRDGATNPGPPFRLGAGTPPGTRSGTPPGRAAERRGGDAGAAGAATRHGASRALPFEGLRILDMTSFWAGPLTGHMLALLGAEVIHLESATRPDGARLVGGVPQTEDRYWERGPIFAALNTNKKSLTINLSERARPRPGAARHRHLRRGGRELHAPRPGPAGSRLRVAAGGPTRPHHGAHARVRARRAGRDLSAFAFVIEDAAGLTWLTGHPDLLPFEPYCVGDPNAGLHASVRAAARPRAPGADG